MHVVSCIGFVAHDLYDFICLLFAFRRRLFVPYCDVDANSTHALMMHQQHGSTLVMVMLAPRP
jgi:hypothetical protein